MGSLALAGAIGGAGTGLREHVAGRRTTRLQDDEQAHQVQLQTQRDKAAETRATSRETFDVSQSKTRSAHETGMADIQYERDIGMAETLYERESGLQEKDIDFKVWKTNADNESDEFQSMFGKWLAASGGGAGSRGSAGEWNVQFEREFDDQGNTITKMLADHPSGVAMEQVGNKLVHVADQELRAEGLSEFEDPQMQAKVEKTLWDELEKGNDTGQRFLKKYNYLPHWYMVKKFEADNADTLGDFWGYFNRDRGRPGGPDMSGRAMPLGVAEKRGGSGQVIGTGVPGEVAPNVPVDQALPTGAAPTGAAPAAAPTPEAIPGAAPVTTPQGGTKAPGGGGALSVGAGLSRLAQQSPIIQRLGQVPESTGIRHGSQQ